MNEFLLVLRQFDINRKNKINVEWNNESVADCFNSCAENILTKGYFLVNAKYIIDIGAIELYYHEEQGVIKDFIMYHTNSHPSKSKIFELEGGFPYFDFGSFNLHQSGVDVTFENFTEKYRASFLIRSYRVLTKEEELLNNLEPFDACSTHLFDDMFYSGANAKIEWVKYNKGGNILRCPRRNVAEYAISEKGKGEKVRAFITDEEYQKNKSKYIKIKNKEYYKQDMRPWQFLREGILEK